MSEEVVLGTPQQVLAAILAVVLTLGTIVVVAAALGVISA